MNEELLAERKKQTQWLQFLGLQQVRPLLEATLTSDEHRLVYELSNGENSVREIARATKVSATTISRWWSQWAGLGLVVASDSYPGRWERLVSLELLGVEVQALPRSSST